MTWSEEAYGRDDPDYLRRKLNDAEEENGTLRRRLNEADRFANSMAYMGSLTAQRYCEQYGYDWAHSSNSIGTATVNYPGKIFFRDGGRPYRAIEMQISQELLDDDRGIAGILRLFLDEHGAAVVSVFQKPKERVTSGE